MASEPSSDLRALWDFDDPGGSEERFRVVVERTTGADRERALTQVARAMGLLGRTDAAHGVLDRLHAHDPEVRVRRELERGRLLRSAGDPDAARPHFLEASASAAEADLEELQVDALHMIALVVPVDEQLTRTEHALDVARRARDPRAKAWEASLLNNLGMTHADAGNFDLALTAFEEALAARERLGDPATTRIARWTVGWALRNLGRGDEARQVQLALREELRAVGASDVYVEEELALLGSEPLGSEDCRPGAGPGAGGTGAR